MPQIITCRLLQSPTPGTVTPWACEVVGGPEHVKTALADGTRGSSPENALGNMVSLLMLRFPTENFEVILASD